MTSSAPRGFAFLDRPGLREQLDLVKRVERLGYDSVWAAESRLVRDAVSPLGAFAVVTDRIRLGALLNSWTRGPALMALTFATLHELAPDRLLLGVGPYWDPLAAKQGIRRQHPLIQMREYLTVLRRLLNLEEGVTLSGEEVRVNDLTLDLGHGVSRHPLGVALYVLGTNEEMAELGAEIADGVILNGFSPTDTSRRFVERMAAAARRCGREPLDVDRPQFVNVAMDDNEGTARDEARSLIALYVGQQAHFGAAAGLDPQLVHRIREAVGGWPARRGGLEDARRLIDDALVDRLMVAGTPPQCRERLTDWIEAGASSVVIVPVSANAAEICEALAPGA